MSEQLWFTASPGDTANVIEDLSGPDVVTTLHHDGAVDWMRVPHGTPHPAAGRRLRVVAWSIGVCVVPGCGNATMHRALEQPADLDAPRLFVSECVCSGFWTYTRKAEDG